jgi:hypothetical protein
VADYNRGKRPITFGFSHNTFERLPIGLARPALAIKLEIRDG